MRAAVIALLIVGAVYAQQPGHQKDNTLPDITTYRCTKSGGCTPKSGKVVLDSNWMWVHEVGTYTNCFTGNSWDSSLCPDPDTCAANCALDGGDYEQTYGVSVSGETVRINFVTKGQYATNVGARLYLMASGSKYDKINYLNQEIAVDVDYSQLPCGLNGAFYTVEMDADGGMSRYPGNKAGAAYGTGYCDAQCPQDMKFIDGKANVDGWQPSKSDPNTGTGNMGSCCPEMDLIEANAQATAVTGHPCTVKGQTSCTGDKCGGEAGPSRYHGVCDKDGADFNPYRNGDKTFYGEGSSFAMDSSQKMTVVTQFITADGTSAGELSEIRRFYVQNGKATAFRNVTLDGKQFNSISDGYAMAEQTAFNSTPSYLPHGGTKSLGESLGRGHVLVMSLWADDAAHMLWLDSAYPTTSPAQDPGVIRGPCATSTGDPSTVIKKYASAYVTYSNIKIGDIGSTTGGITPNPTPTPTPSACPGGSLAACIKLCPSSPPAAYKACVQACAARCSPSAL